MKTTPPPSQAAQKPRPLPLPPIRKYDVETDRTKAREAFAALFSKGA